MATKNKPITIKVGYQPYDPINKRNELRKSTAKASSKKATKKGK